jgi:uncharacterized protein (TIGR03118 family)
MLKSKLAFYFFFLICFGLGFSASDAGAQSIAYRQLDLASNVPDLADNLTQGLVNPWGIAFLSGQPFFIANNQSGRVTSHDAKGSSLGLRSFTIPNATGTGFEHATGIIADQNSSFGGSSLVQPFILVTEEGSIFAWGPDARGNFPPQATLERRRASAVYTGVTMLNSAVAQPTLAVADFNGGFIDTFLPGFSGVALPGSFIDPNLPAGFAPFGIQAIGSQVFVTYALQDAAKHDPIAGAGNGVVSIFDLDGNFVKRFATAGALNAPWGVAKASANFGPFSNDILIANAGDGTINAFDPASGNFVGTLLDGAGNAIVNSGLHALTFRSDNFGDPNTLYLTAGIGNGLNGVFAAITSGLVSFTRMDTPLTSIDANVLITATIIAGPGNRGTPTGQVTFLDGGNQLGVSSVINGVAGFNTTFDKVGTHTITAQYSGDATFLPSSENLPLKVSGFATRAALAAPTEAALNSTVTLTATISSAGGIPTGEVTFADGRNTTLGTSPVDATGVAVLRIDTLAAGDHSLSAAYSGDGKFASSTSPSVTLTVTGEDFSVGANPPTATVTAGQSTQFRLSVTPAGGFTGNVAFSCSPLPGISCTFSPATVSSANGAASTMLTVTTSATVSHYGMVLPGIIGPGAFLVALALFMFAAWRAKGVRIVRIALLPASAAAVIVAMGLAIGGCGGYSKSAQPNHGTAAVMVTARSGAISHTTTINITVQ